MRQSRNEKHSVRGEKGEKAVNGNQISLDPPVYVCMWVSKECETSALAETEDLAYTINLK